MGGGGRGDEGTGGRGDEGTGRRGDEGTGGQERLRIKSKIQNPKSKILPTPISLLPTPISHILNSLPIAPNNDRACVIGSNF